MPTLTALPPLSDQVRRLDELGLLIRAGLAPAELAAADLSTPDRPDTLLAIDPRRLPASVLTPHVRLRERPGFVVSDLTDVDEFAATTAAPLPSGPAYLVHGVDRGDHLANWSPDEAEPALAAAGRTPLTLTEGLLWLIQQTDALERGRCFMTIGSRRTRPDGRLDTRTPAIWISNGTGRDGPERRHAPKVGWCWAGNRHTWLGFASAASRAGLATRRG